MKKRLSLKNRIIKGKYFKLGIVLLPLLFVGCAVPIHITSEPSGAVITIIDKSHHKELTLNSVTPSNLAYSHIELVGSILQNVDYPEDKLEIPGETKNELVVRAYLAGYPVQEKKFTKGDIKFKF